MEFDFSRYETPNKYGKEVLGPSGVAGSYNERAVDSPFVFWHNGKYCMMHVGFDGIGYQTALAYSDDLLHWKTESVLFPREELSGWDKTGVAGVWMLKENNLYGLPVLKKWQGKYWMVYHSYPANGYEAGSANIGIAYTEDTSLHSWVRFPQPVLRWQDGNEWERGGLYKGCLVESKGRFYLFYNAKEKDEWPWHEQIGLAVSEDMVTWRRIGDTPIIQNTQGEWDAYFCADPCVVQDEGRWIMFYYGYDGQHAQEGIACSRDLLHWQKKAIPILHSGGSGDIDELHAHKPSVIAKGKCLYHFYCAVRSARQDDHAQNLDPTRTEDAATEYRSISVAMSE